MMTAFLALYVMALCISSISSSLIRAPSVFRSDEADMHKYSAVLATTEPFRKQCLHELNKRLNPLQHVARLLQGRDVFQQATAIRSSNRAVDEVLNKFEHRVENTLKSYGMNTNSFNSLSEYIDKQPSVKKRVRLQAYFYKIVADLEGNLKKTPPMLPSLSASHATVGASDGEVPSSEAAVLGTTPTERFAQSLRDIENSRLKIHESIKRELKVRDLPPNMADPDLLPAMALPIQKACADFPQIAQKIVSMYGFHEDEFDSLQTRMKRSWWFRHRVQQALQKLDDSLENDY